MIDTRPGDAAPAVLGYIASGAAALALACLLCGWWSTLPAAVAAIANGHVSRAETPPDGRASGPALAGLLLGYTVAALYVLPHAARAAVSAWQQLQP